MLDLEALERLVNDDVAALMVTNPNTLGVFENEHRPRSPRSCTRKGALLYMDGANMNALVGMARPGDFGVDVMHLNLHKTFSTPHGGGGPGVGSGGGEEDPGAVPADAGRSSKRRTEQLALRLQPSAVDRARARVLRQFRRAGARAGLHPGATGRMACADAPKTPC